MRIFCGFQVTEKISYSGRAESWASRCRATAFPVTFSVSRDQLTLSGLFFLVYPWNCRILWVFGSCVSYSACALLVVRHAFSLSLCFRRDRNASCVNSANYFCFILGKNYICFKDACFNPSDKRSLLLLLWL